MVQVAGDDAALALQSQPMIPLFLGLHAANLLLLSLVFALGLLAMDNTGQPSGWYAYHISLAIVAGLYCAFAHVAVYTYFMATSKWLMAASDKAGLDPTRFVVPGKRHKSRALALAMTGVIMTMLAMFAGAAADPTLNRWWPGQVHLVIAAAAIAANLLAALGEYRLIRAQGRLMDDVLAIFNRPGAVDL